MKTSFIVFALLLCTGLKAQYNFESCYAFWDITAKLKQGILPAEPEWQALHQTAGYKRKNISVARWKEFSEKITFAFTPGNRDSLTILSKYTLSYKIIWEYLQQEENLKQFVANIDGLGIADSAAMYVKRKLPEAYQHCFKPPIIYFALWDYDGSATADYVCVDLLLSYHMSRFKPGIFEAHEMYHAAVLACRMKTSRFKGNPSKKHTGAFIAVNAISTEGTADLIDKEWVVFNRQSPYLHKDTFQVFSDTQAPVCIQKISETLEKLAEKKHTPYSNTSFWMQLIPWAAHIPGAYMSNIIKRNGLQEQAFAQTSNSFQFFYIYNQAAAADADARPLFSPKAIRFLQLLERKYIR